MNMKARVFCFLCLNLLLFGVLEAQVYGIADSGDTTFFSRDEISLHKTKIFNGVIIYLDSTLNKRVESARRDGELHGYYVVMINGKAKTVGNHYQGKEVGTWLEFYESGAIKSIQNFDLNGRLDGLSVSFDNEGRPITQSRYREGRLLEW
jgi:antitoxin component YwqK of YwqJK toxin-antitoxin module